MRLQSQQIEEVLQVFGGGMVPLIALSRSLLCGPGYNLRHPLIEKPYQRLTSAPPYAILPDTQAIRADITVR